MAYFSQHDNPLLLRRLPVQVAWDEKIPHSLLCRRHTGECSLPPSSNITICRSCGCLRSYICPRRSAHGDETKIEGVYFPHTSPASPLGGSYWDFPYTFLFPTGSLAGSPWRSGSRPDSRLLLQKADTLLLHLTAALPMIHHNWHYFEKALTG